MPDFRLPDLGEGLTEAEIVGWRVAVGDVVEIDQVVVEVETAKAAVEVPVPFAGRVAALHGEPGQTLAVGSPLLTVDSDAAGLREPGVVTAGATSGASGNVLIGYGTREPQRRRRPTRRTHESIRPAAPVPDGPVPVISPLVRRLAQDAGLDLTRIAGTGPAGLVRRCDVEKALGERAAAPADTRVPLRGVQRAVAELVSRSRREIPEATVWVDVDATELLAARRTLNARASEPPVSVLGLLARFTVLGVAKYPELNARVDGDEIVLHHDVHLGFAAQTERGLVVPVVHDAHRLSTRALSQALAERTAAARDGQLSPGDLTNGTITVNNYGVFGVDGSATIINHPQVAIVGLGRIIDRPWVIDGELAVRKISQLTLAFDHRVCDGGTAGGFLRYLADCVESPILALADA